MSTTLLYLDAGRENMPITRDLYKIARAINRGQSQQSIFNAYCQRTGQSLVTDHQLIMKHDASEEGYTFTTTWRKRDYHSFTYSNEDEARENLFSQLVSAVIAKELKTAGKLHDAMERAADELSDEEVEGTTELPDGEAVGSPQ